MAGPVVISILANASQANRQLNQTATIGQRIGSGFKRAAVPAAALLGVLATGLAKATKAAAEDQAAQSRLAQTLKTAGGATESQIASTEKWIAAQGLALGITDDELRPAIGRLTAATGSVTKAQKLTSLAMNVSAGTGKSLETVTTALAKAQTGSLGGLSRLGIATKNAKGETKSLAEVQEELASKYRGAAGKAAETAAGKQKILSVQLGELQEQIGAKLLPVLTKMAGYGLKAVEWMSNNTGVVKIFVGIVAAMAVAILAVNAAMALNPAVLIIAGIVALGAALVVAYQKSARFRAICQQVAQFVRGQVVPALMRFGNYLRTVVIPAVVATAQRIGQSLKPILTQLANFIRGSVIPVVQKVAAKFREWWPTIQRIIVVAAKLYGKFLEFYAAVAGKVIPIIIRFAGFVLRTVVPAVVAYVSVVVKIIGKIIEFGRKVVEAVKKVAQFVTGVRQKFGEALAFIGTIPGRITGALGNLGSLLLDIGKQIIQGLIDGIESALGALQDKLAAVTDLIPDWKGPMSKDKRLLRPTGRAIMGGLINGIGDGTSGVEKVLGRITDLIEKTVNKRVKDDKAAKRAIAARIKGLRDEYAALKANGKMQDRVSAALEAARAKVTDLRKASADYTAQIRDAVVSAASITSLGEGVGYGSVDQMLAILRGKVAESEAYTAMIARLRKAGLNRTTLDELIGAGVAGAGAASTLLSGGSAAIRQYNALAKRLAATGSALGTGAADSLYKSGIRAAEGIAAGLAREQSKLDRVAERMGRRLAAEAMRGLGGNQNQRRTAVDAYEKETARRANAKGGNTYNIKVDVKPGGNPVDTGRELVKAIKAYERAGGR